MNIHYNVNMLGSGYRPMITLNGMEVFDTYKEAADSAHEDVAQLFEWTMHKLKNEMGYVWEK